MKAFCTYCSREKRHDIPLMPAIQRYKSTRICNVYTAALSLNSAFFILSGKFGLISPCHHIPDYDHALKDEEAGEFSKKVASQLAEVLIDDLVYVTKPISRKPDLRPYLEAIKRACALAGVTLYVFELPDDGL